MSHDSPILSFLRVSGLDSSPAIASGFFVVEALPISSEMFRLLNDGRLILVPSDYSRFAPFHISEAEPFCHWF